MAQVYFSKVLNVPPESAWRIIRDFGSLPRWFPFVKRSELRGGGPFQPGTIRANTVADGSVIEERLLELSDRDRRVVYDIVAADIPTKNYSAALRVHEIAADPARCFIEWTADFHVEGDREAAIDWVRNGIFKTCLESLERVVAGAHAHVKVAANSGEGASNAAIVQRAFEEWAAGGTRFFELLDEDCEWTIAGSGRSAQTFHGREAFLSSAFRPIADRFATPMKPQVKGLYADGDEVIIRWDGAARLKDGQMYRNSYAWFFQMRGGRVIRATAFLDLPTYDAALDRRPLPSWGVDDSGAVQQSKRALEV